MEKKGPGFIPSYHQYFSLELAIDTGSVQFGASLLRISQCVSLLYRICCRNKLHESILEKASPWQPVSIGKLDQCRCTQRKINERKKIMLKLVTVLRTK